MNQPSEEPEYILEESEKIHLTGKVQANLDRDFLQVVVDLEDLYQQAIRQVDTSIRIASSLRALVQSLRGTV